MKIKYLGHSCFKLISQSGKSVITDPYRGVGYELPAGVCADIVTVSHGHFDHNYVAAVQAKRIVDSVDGYGDDEVQIRAVPCNHDPKGGTLRGKNLIFIIKMDGLTLCHLGDVGEECSLALQKEIGKVDILLLPVGGTYTVDALSAKGYVDALAPKAVIPMHYKPKDGSLDITDAEPFLSLYKAEQVVRVPLGEVDVDGDTCGVLYMEREA